MKMGPVRHSKEGRPCPCPSPSFHLCITCLVGMNTAHMHDRNRACISFDRSNPTVQIDTKR